MISPTLACANYLTLQNDIETMDKAGVDFYHIDIMDGHYVPNICLNFDFIKAVRKVSNTPIDVHLMVTNPLEYIERLSNHHVQYISGHIDLLKDTSKDFINKIHEFGMKAGLVLSPSDEIQTILPYLDDVDYILVMFVTPGFYGQNFMETMLLKVKELKRIRDKRKLDFLIEADGGIDWDNILLLTEAGVDISVAGIFTVFDEKANLYDSTVKFRQLSSRKKDYCSEINKSNDYYKKIATEIRLMAIEGVYNAQSGHLGGSLSICDILSVLFFKYMNINIDNQQNPNRDRFVLSKGHAAPAYYGALALKGFFDKCEMKSLRSIDSFLQGHPCLNKVPGVDMSTGSLGQGLSAANGMALVAKYDKKDYRVYCICGDGEMQEGQIWEAVMTAAHYKLDNVTLFIDCNNLQIDGEVKNVMNVYPIGAKFKSFEWNVIEIDGHNFDDIDRALTRAINHKEKPTVIICNTIKGKGVSFMENQVSWHGALPNEEQYNYAVAELTAERNGD